MPRDIVVTLQDGQQRIIKNAPDGVTPQEVVAEAKRMFGPTVASIEGAAPAQQDKITADSKITPEEIGRDLKLAGSSALQGLMDLPGLAMKIGEYAFAPPGQYPSYYKDTKEGAPEGLDRLQEAIDVPAQTPGEEYTKSAFRGVGGSVGPGILRAPATTVLSGAGAGLGSEAAADIGGDTMLNRILGSLVGGGTLGSITNRLGSAVKPNTAAILREGLEGLTPEDLARAKQTMLDVEKNFGIKLDVTQALSKDSTLTAIRDALANSKYGDLVQSTLKAQPERVGGVLRSELMDLPGEVKASPQEAANAAQDAATEVLRRAKASRQAAVNPLYEKAGALPGTNRALVSTIDNLLLDTRLHSDAVRADLKALRSDLLDQKQTREVRAAKAESTGKPYRAEPVEKAQELNDLLKNFWGSYKEKPLMARNPAEERQAAIAATALREVFDTASEGTKQANDLYAQITRDTINPLRKSPIGRLATPRGAQPDREAALATLRGIFERGTDPNAMGTSEILTLAKHFKRVAPDAYRDAAKTWLSDKLAGVVKYNEDGIIDPTTMKGIKNALYSTAAQRQGLDDVLAGIAQVSDLPPSRVVGAFKGFMNVVEKTAKRPESIGRLPPQEVARMAGKSKLADAIRFWGFTANMTAGRRIEERVLGRTMQELDKLLTTKEGVEYLQKIAQDGYVSPNALILGATALSSIGASGGPNQNTEKDETAQSMQP